MNLLRGHTGKVQSASRSLTTRTWTCRQLELAGAESWRIEAEQGPGRPRVRFRPSPFARTGRQQAGGVLFNLRSGTLQLSRRRDIVLPGQDPEAPSHRPPRRPGARPSRAGRLLRTYPRHHHHRQRSSRPPPPSSSSRETWNRREQEPNEQASRAMRDYQHHPETFDSIGLRRHRGQLGPIHGKRRRARKCDPPAPTGNVGCQPWAPP